MKLGMGCEAGCDDLLSLYPLSRQEWPFVGRGYLPGIGGLGKAMSWGKRLEGEYLWNLQEMGAGGMEGWSRCSNVELGVRLED